MTFISVIIINWNGKKFIQECLNGLKEQTFKDFSIIVVDNASKDGSLQLIKRNYPEVKTVALSENLGFAVANNIAIESVKTEYVALLYPDAVPHPGWLENHPQAAFAASKVLFYDNLAVIDRAGDVYTRAGAGLLRDRALSGNKYESQGWIFWACAGTELYRTNMLLDIGFFDEDFFLLWEDVDLSFRTQFRGYRCLYVPEAIVYHKASRSIIYSS